MNRQNLTLALAAVAAAAALVAVGVAATNAGPQGPRGVQGTAGPAGTRGIPGPVGGTESVDQIKACLPELASWLQGFRVESAWESGSDGVNWLTSAYLDTSSQQVSSKCRKVLGIGVVGD